ncbi:TPA: hypothetical protein HA242_01295 [Candidatus Woesearchaeota archaeon]|nr:hypothetical protein [Candidatus Woesearchaeota archaeon]HIG93546.1 hypothetical protein [Candidatus Woesearchaeota archaeon]HIH12333.1 hypothetical protein [Candidatus Woesearchaeota archaeon]
MLLICFSLFSFLALAAVEVETDDLTIPVNYDSLRDNKEELEVSRAITIRNTGDAPENITLALANLPSAYRLSLSQTAIQLAAGASQDVTVSGKVPVNADQGVSEIGDLKVTAGAETTYRLKTDVKSMIKIKRTTAFVNGIEKKNIDEQDDLKNLEPGDVVELKFRLENLFDEDYDNGDLEGTIRIQLDDSDFDEEIDEEESFSLDAGKRIDSTTDEIVLSFTIPRLAKDSDYSMDIEIEAEDGNNANFIEKMELVLEVDRKQDDVRVETLTITPAEISCVRRSQIVAKVSNFGSNRQPHASLTLVNADLGINTNENFELSSGTNEKGAIVKSTALDLSNDIKPGSYPIVATAYYDFNQFADRKTVELVVKKCTTQPEAPAPEPTPAQPNSTAQAESEPQPVTGTEEDINTDFPSSSSSALNANAVVKTIEIPPYTAEDFLIAGIIIVIIFLLALIVVFFMILIK